MSVSIDHAMLADKYLRDPQEFASLVRTARCHVAGGFDHDEGDLGSYADEALDLLEAVYAIRLEQEMMV